MREEHVIPGADRFLARLREREIAFLVLTNNSTYTRRDLAARLALSGIDVPEESIWTSALATTARFLDSRAQAERFPYRPSRIVESVADLVDELGECASAT